MHQVLVQVIYVYEHISPHSKSSGGFLSHRRFPEEAAEALKD